MRIRLTGTGSVRLIGLDSGQAGRKPTDLLQLRVCADHPPAGCQNVNGLLAYDEVLGVLECQCCRVCLVGRLKEALGPFDARKASLCEFSGIGDRTERRQDREYSCRHNLPVRQTSRDLSILRGN